MLKQTKEHSVHLSRSKLPGSFSGSSVFQPSALPTSHQHLLPLGPPYAPALHSCPLLFPVPHHAPSPPSTLYCHWTGPFICFALHCVHPAQAGHLQILCSAHSTAPLCAMSASPPPPWYVFCPLSARSPCSPCSPLVLSLSSLLVQPPWPCSNWWCVLACVSVGHLSLFLPHLTSLSLVSPRPGSSTLLQSVRLSRRRQRDHPGISMRGVLAILTATG